MPTWSSIIQNWKSSNCTFVQWSSLFCRHNQTVYVMTKTASSRLWFIWFEWTGESLAGPTHCDTSVASGSCVYCQSCCDDNQGTVNLDHNLSLDLSVIENTIWINFSLFWFLTSHASRTREGISHAEMKKKYTETSKDLSATFGTNDNNFNNT